MQEFCQILLVHKYRHHCLGYSPHIADSKSLFAPGKAQWIFLHRNQLLQSQRTMAIDNSHSDYDNEALRLQSWHFAWLQLCGWLNDSGHKKTSVTDYFMPCCYVTALWALVSSTSWNLSEINLKILEMVSHTQRYLVWLHEHIICVLYVQVDRHPFSTCNSNVKSSIKEVSAWC